ncbi:MAG TPA: HIT domain-containing protein [Acidimicrobiales bacterium]|nr:HIT domain-containing protein [Acidimicrobiales bacterium]
MPLERFSAAWREQYVSSATSGQGTPGVGHCVFCELADAEVSEDSGVLWRSATTYVALNAFPYGSGHLLVLPVRHVAALEDLAENEYQDLFLALRRVVVALQGAYEPDGLNVGMNLGQAGGAGIPQHLHGHVLPRWHGDTNFMTTIGETRVLPESLQSTWQKVRAQLEVRP